MKKKMNIGDIKFLRYHSSLPENLVKRLKKLYPSISEILSYHSVDEWVDEFCYDMHPEREIRIWENMIEVLESCCKTYGIRNKKYKLEIFNKILKHSMGMKI